MRVMTWNIRTGGGDRLPAILAVVRRVRPDLLALQELRGFDRRRISEFAAGLGMTAHLAPSVFGQPVAVLARSALTRTVAIRWRLHHAAAAATVGPLTLVSTHLNPFSPYRRLREATFLAARFGSARRPVILAGDLNSLDPDTDHTATLERLPARYHSRHVTGGAADTRAIAAFRDGGLHDLWPAAGTGDPATAPTTQGGGPEFSGMRLDYLLATAPVRAKTLSVVRGDEAEHASDHYPVVADVDL